MAGQPIVRLVQDDDAWFSRADQVSLFRTLTAPPHLHAVRDDDGPYEVLGCSRVPVDHRRLLQLVLREIKSV